MHDSIRNSNTPFSGVEYDADITADIRPMTYDDLLDAGCHFHLPTWIGGEQIDDDEEDW